MLCWFLYEACCVSFASSVVSSGTWAFCWSARQRVEQVAKSVVFCFSRGSREVGANPSSLLPLVSYLFLLPRILFLLLMLNFPIHSQGNPLPAVWKPQQSNNLLLNEVFSKRWKREHLWCCISGSYKGVRYSRSWDLDVQIVISWSLSPRSLQWFSSYLTNQKQPKPLVRMNYPKLFTLLPGFHKETSWDRYCFLCISTSYLLLLNIPRYHCMLTRRFFNASTKYLNSWRASWMQISTT